jgi:deoxyribodipyrimidine photolyase
VKTNVYKIADNLINIFLEKKIIKYSNLRNYDYGQENPHKIVSGLSPFISHGIINELDILNKLSNSKNKCDKFKQEILWRTYWKGWLEHNKYVWDNYKKNLNFYKKNVVLGKRNSNYDKAINGKTNIEPYDNWVQQLKNTGYLHNHTRMWFASIWIYYLKLPWELGANFFIENLIDGDIASNTLSWRWVAGIQTKGKGYLVNKENIRKYTFNKFSNYDLPEIKDPIILGEEVLSNNFLYDNKLGFNKNNKTCVFMLENNLNLNFLRRNKKFISEVILLRLSCKGINKNNILLDFENQACKDFLYSCINLNIKVKSYNIESSSENLIKYLNEKKIKEIITNYIPVGYERDVILKLKKDFNKYSINITELLEPFYFKAWSYCNKGYFNFKKHFDKFTDEISKL